MIYQKRIMELAKRSNATVGIGSARSGRKISYPFSKVLGSGTNKRVIIFKSANALATALWSGEVDCAVRGTLSALEMSKAIASRFSCKNLGRAVVMDRGKKGFFLLTPVGITEGKGAEAKVRLGILCGDYLKMFGTNARIAVMAGGRREDAVRNNDVAKSIAEGLKVVRILKREQSDGINAVFTGIELEKAVIGSNCVLAPDGVSGNLIFRSLHYLGGWEALGAPALGLLADSGVVYIDTSRSKTDFTGPIALAAATWHLVQKKGFPVHDSIQTR